MFYFYSRLHLTKGDAFSVLFLGCLLLTTRWTFAPPFEVFLNFCLPFRVCVLDFQTLNANIGELYPEVVGPASSQKIYMCVCVHNFMIHFTNMGMCSKEFTDSNKIDNTIYFKFHIANWLLQNILLIFAKLPLLQPT